MLVIGLGHKARQGKNTAAMAILEASPLETDIRMVAFADELRREVKTAIRQAGSVENLIEGFKEAGLMPDWVVPEKYPAKQRTLLQWWGTEHRRKQDPDYWVKRLFARLTELSPDVAIVTDLRYPNEAAAIKAAGGFLVKVTRTTPPDVQVPQHASESALDNYRGWDFHLEAADIPTLKALCNATYHDITQRRT